MVQHTDTHMGKARVLAHTCIYGLPVRVWAAHTRTGSPYAYELPVRVWAAHVHMGQPIRV